ncbi:MAG: isocitrate lyase/phosphoenolpyruvate mutase family protein [Myroides sp.]|jgi:2-methylisocitrate lyase-like PEP mutase family enzyme|nr:isocitrate lyase/phosphoenolpyruvate mutase family protein [Myroides sp.]
MNYLQFKDLHHADSPLVLGNVWNVQSALVFEKLGFKAIGTSSAAIAHSLGYQDGEEMPFKDMLFIVSRICKSVSIPVTVDLESGYGATAQKVFENIKQLYALGVLGINIEDSYVINGKRKQKDKERFYEFLSELLDLVRSDNMELFINIRCDSFLSQVHADQLKDACDRIILYQKAAIDGIFLPGIVDVEDIKQIKEVLTLPLNVMCMPGLPDFYAIKDVERISMGNFQNEYIYEVLSEINGRIIQEQSFKVLFQK